VRILANTTSISSALPAALASFLARHPDVSIDLHERLSHEIVIAINEAHADIGLVAGNVDTEGLEVRDFVGDELVVVVPQGHRLAAEGPQVGFVETLDEHHISLAEGSALASFLPPLARAIGRQLEFRIQVSSFESICLLVEAGVGIGIIPRSSALRHARTMKLKIVPLSDDWARRETKIVNRAHVPLPKLAAELIRHLANFNFEERLL
jgi:DNA-binding transcriptional LysR family regulator